MATFPGSGALRTNVNTKYRKALVQREMYRMIHQRVVFGPKVTFRFRRPLGGSWAQPELLVPVLGLQAELALSKPILSAPSDGGGASVSGFRSQQAPKDDLRGLSAPEPCLELLAGGGCGVLPPAEQGGDG